MNLFSFGQSKISLRVILIILLFVAMVLILEWRAFSYLKEEHSEEIRQILLDITIKDALSLSFKIERRVDFLNKISKKEDINSKNYLEYFDEAGALVSFYVKGWISINGDFSYIKTNAPYKPQIASSDLDRFLNEDETVSFVDIDNQRLLGLSKAVYNKQNQKIGTLVAFLADSILHLIPFEKQQALLFMNKDGKIIKELNALEGEEKSKKIWSDFDLSEMMGDSIYQEAKVGGFLLHSKNTKKSYYAVFAPLEINDWVLVSLFPSEVIEGRLRHFNFLFRGLFFFSAILLLYIFLLRRFYRSDLEKIASFDRLTSALTKNKLFWLLKMSYKSPIGYKEALIVSNIRNFGLFNTIFGREASDTILKRTKILIEQKLKKKELIARSFADRFYIVLHYKEEEELIKRLECIAKDMLIHNEDITGTYPMQYCFGVYKVPKHKKKEYSEMFDLAEMALKREKDSLSKTIYFYDDLIQKCLEKEMIIESHMKEALVNKEFLMYLQPKYDTVTEQIVGAEALVRWQRGDDLLFPDSFIHIFEHNGFISKLDMYMLEQVCLFQRHRLNHNKTCFPISVNQSRILLYNPNYVDLLIDLVDQYEIPHHLIDLEITESVVFDDKDLAIKTFKRLLDSGFNISMDDFGSGYSSLNMLKEIEVNIIKIDRAFLENFMNSDRGKKVMFSVLGLIRDLKLISIAEGVETKEQLSFLKNAGCHWVQGFYFSKPMTVSDFLKLVDKE